MKKKMLVGGVLVFMVLVFSGCGPSDRISEKAGEKLMEKMIETQTGGKVDVNTGKQTMDITTKDGTVSVSQEGEGKLPNDFPKDIFIFSDAKITVSTSGSAESKSFSISYSTATGQNDAIEKYKSEMTGNGWSKESEMNFGAEQGAFLNFKKGDLSVAVTIGTDQEKNTFITVIGAENKENL